VELKGGIGGESGPLIKPRKAEPEESAS
jgi:hypothetical protein